MKNFLLLLIFFPSLVQSNGEIPLDTRVSGFYEALIMSMEQKFRAKDILSKWDEKSLDFENEHQFHLKNHCYQKSKGEVLLVLVVEASGLISSAYASKENTKAECFINSYEGLVFPKPPIAPRYVFMRML